MLEPEVNSVGASLPVQTSGDLNAKGHPLGAADVAKCVKLFQPAARRCRELGGVGAGIGLANNYWRLDCCIGRHDLGGNPRVNGG